jgi:uncharacterized protein YggU (UPF0235/DUF167 family)
MRLNVIVIPNSKTDRLVMEEGRSKVFLNISKNDPDSNKALIKFLSKHFFVPKSRISIISGENRREKLVQVMKG